MSFDEMAIRHYWAPKLWRQKNFDSEAEFLELGRCFACGMDDEALNTRKPSQDEPAHLLCKYCYSDSRNLSAMRYLEWFEARSSLHTIAAHILRKTARLMQQPGA